jgi:hypothetical protein
VVTLPKASISKESNVMFALIGVVALSKLQLPTLALTAEFE